MADITSYYTVKQDQRGELKLILARDPRASVAKLPSKLGGGSQHQVVVPSIKSTIGDPHTDAAVHTVAAKPQVVTAGNVGQKKQQAHLPVSRVRTIMKTNVKSSQNTLLFSQDSVMTITKATVSASDKLCDCYKGWSGVASFRSLHAQRLSLTAGDKSWVWQPGNEAGSSKLAIEHTLV